MSTRAKWAARAHRQVDFWWDNSERSEFYTCVCDYVGSERDFREIHFGVQLGGADSLSNNTCGREQSVGEDGAERECRK